jgi:hypothetical protein
MTQPDDRYGPVVSEITARPTRESKLTVVDAPRSTKTPRLTAPGTIMVYLAKKRTHAIDEVRAAFKEGGRRLEKLQTDIHKQLKRTKSSSPKAFVELMLRQPVLADIRYGGATLNSGFFLPKGVDLFPIPVAYNGGRLAREGFTLAEYYKEGSDAALEGIVVCSAPSLTDAEKAALRLVPQDQLVRNVAGLADWCDSTWWAIAAAVVAAAEITVQVTCVCAAMEEVHLSENALKRLGPAASARKLIELRRQVFANSL